MITAFVLVRAARDRNPETAEALAAMKFVSECYSVTGDWDIVVVLRFPHFEDLDEIVTGHLRKIPGIERTSTMLAFKAFNLCGLIPRGLPRSFRGGSTLDA